MKRLFIALSLAFGILLVTTGCGDDDDKVLPPEEIVLDFGTVGDYDLSKYIFPTTEQINNYRDKVYKNSDGKREYDSIDANETFYSVRYEVTDSLVEEFREDVLEVKYHIQSDRIKSELIENNKTIEIVRYTDSGEYIIKNESEVTIDGRHGTDSLLCKVANVINEKVVLNTTYEDVLEITCIIEDISSGIFNGSEFETNKDGTEVIYFAKDIGKISSVSDICDTTTLNSLSEIKCEKVTTELTTIN